MRERQVTLAALAIPAILAAAYPLLPEYQKALLTRVMILSIYSYGYAVCFQMTGIMSLGHAALFAAGMYGAGLYAFYISPDPLAALAVGLLSSVLLSILLGALASRVGGPYVMIGTLLASQTLYLAALHFNDITGGEQGLVLRGEAAIMGALRPVLSELDARYIVSLIALTVAAAVMTLLSFSRLGRMLQAVRDDEEKLESMGYNTSLLKLIAFVISGVLSGASGSLSALLYGYVGAGYAGVLNSVEPLLWVLVGGPYVEFGPFLGCLLVNLLADTARGFLRGHVLVVGAGLVAIALATGKLRWAYQMMSRWRSRGA